LKWGFKGGCPSKSNTLKCLNLEKHNKKGEEDEKEGSVALWEKNQAEENFSSSIRKLGGTKKKGPGGGRKSQI